MVTFKLLLAGLSRLALLCLLSLHLDQLRLLLVVLRALLRDYKYIWLWGFVGLLQHFRLILLRRLGYGILAQHLSRDSCVGHLESGEHITWVLRRALLADH